MTSEENFNCIFCKESFHDKETLQIHFRQHGNPNQHYMITKSKKMPTAEGQPSTDNGTEEEKDMISCDVCPEVFITISKAITHKHKMHPEYDAKHFCPWCGKLFTMKHLFDKHMKSHESCVKLEQTFPCDSCSVVFNELAAMLYHNKFFHRTDTDFPAIGQTIKQKIVNKEPTPVFYCPFCGEEFINKVNLHKHLNDDHGDEEQNPEEVLRCPLCQAIFYHLDAYDLHLSFHSTEDVYHNEYDKITSEITEFTLESVPPMNEKIENYKPQEEEQNNGTSMGIDQFLQIAMETENDNEASPSTSERHKHKKHKKHKKSKKSAITLDEFLNMNKDVFGEGIDFHGIEEVPTQVVKKQLKRVRNNPSAVVTAGNKVISAANLQKLKQQGVVVKVKNAHNHSLLSGTKVVGNNTAISKPIKVVNNMSSTTMYDPTSSTSLSDSSKVSNPILTKLMNQSSHLKIMKKPIQNEANREGSIREGVTIKDTIKQEYVNIETDDEKITNADSPYDDKDNSNFSLSKSCDKNVDNNKAKEETTPITHSLLSNPQLTIKPMTNVKVKYEHSPANPDLKSTTGYISDDASNKQEHLNDDAMCGQRDHDTVDRLRTNPGSHSKPVNTTNEGDDIDTELYKVQSENVIYDLYVSGSHEKKEVPEMKDPNEKYQNVKPTISNSQLRNSDFYDIKNQPVEVTDICFSSEEEDISQINTKNNNQGTLVSESANKLLGNSQLTITSSNFKPKTDKLDSLDFSNDDNDTECDISSSSPLQESQTTSHDDSSMTQQLQPYRNNICVDSRNKLLGNSELTIKSKTINHEKGEGMSKSSSTNNSKTIKVNRCQTQPTSRSEENVENRLNRSIVQQTINTKFSNFQNANTVKTSCIRSSQQTVNQSNMNMTSINTLKNIKGITVKSSNQSPSQKHTESFDEHFQTSDINIDSSDDDWIEENNHETICKPKTASNRIISHVMPSSNIRDRKGGIDTKITNVCNVNTNKNMCIEKTEQMDISRAMENVLKKQEYFVNKLKSKNLGLSIKPFKHSMSSDDESCNESDFNKLTEMETNFNTNKFNKKYNTLSDVKNPTGMNIKLKDISDNSDLSDFDDMDNLTSTNKYISKKQNDMVNKLKTTNMGLSIKSLKNNEKVSEHDSFDDSDESDNMASNNTVTNTNYNLSNIKNKVGANLIISNNANSDSDEYMDVPPNKECDNKQKSIVNKLKTANVGLLIKSVKQSDDSLAKSAPTRQTEHNTTISNLNNKVGMEVALRTSDDSFSDFSDCEEHIEDSDDFIPKDDLLVNKLKNSNIGLSVKSINKSIPSLNNPSSIRTPHNIHQNKDIMKSNQVYDPSVSNQDKVHKPEQDIRVTPPVNDRSLQVKNVNNDNASRTSSQAQVINQKVATNQSESVSREVTVKTVQTKTVVQEITTTVTKTIRTVNQTNCEESNKIINKSSNVKLPLMQNSGALKVAQDVKRPVLPIKVSNPGTTIRPSISQGQIIRPTYKNIIRSGTQTAVRQMRPTNPNTSVGKKITSAPVVSQTMGKPLKIAPNLMRPPAKVQNRLISNNAVSLNNWKVGRESINSGNNIAEASTSQVVSESRVNVTSQQSSNNFSGVAKFIKSNSVASHTQMKSQVNSSTSAQKVTNYTASKSSQQIGNFSTSTASQQISNFSASTSSQQVSNVRSNSSSMQKSNFSQVTVKNNTNTIQRVPENVGASPKNASLIAKLQQQGLLIKKPRLEDSFSDEGDSYDDDPDNQY